MDIHHNLCYMDSASLGTIPVSIRYDTDSGAESVSTRQLQFRTLDYILDLYHEISRTNFLKQQRIKMGRFLQDQK